MEKGSGNLRAKSYRAKFPTCEKELKKILKLGMVGHTFNGTQMEVNGGNLRLLWSTEQVAEQTSLGSEENQQKQEFSEDVIKHGVMFQSRQAAELGSLNI